MVSGQKVMVWTCGDGERFFDEEEASKYEIRLQVAELIKDNLFNDITLDTIVDIVVCKFDDIEKIVRDL